MRPHLATLLDDFRRLGRETAVVRYTGNRRRVTSYAQIAEQAGRFAALLEQRGIGMGDRVLLWAENSAEWMAAFYGCMLRGVIAVPLDAYGTPDFAARVAADVSPALAVGDASLLKTLSGEWPQLAFEEWAIALPAGLAGPVAELSRETPLQILFTSGTTGEPKGIVHTHGNVLSSMEPIEAGARPYMRYERLIHPLRILHTLPLSHVFGQTMGLWVPPIFAAQLHFENRPAATRMISMIRRERISVVTAVPRVLAALQTYLESEYPELAAKMAAARGVRAAERWWRFRRIHLDFGLKFWAFVTGGGALPGPVEQFWNGLGFVLVQGYGMTETAALITLNHPFHVARGSIGKPLPGREIRLGADGEVQVRGPMISPGTWSGGALHLRENDWLDTGDLAAAEPDGGLRFVGRKSEVIVTGTGVNIHPEDLEAALEAQPEVIACAVVPEETPAGPEPCAVLVLRGNTVQVGSVIQRANANLAEFQYIRHWVAWPEPDLPRTATGKVRRASVTAWLAARKPSAGTALPGSGGDWLIALITRVTGRTEPSGSSGSDSNHLSEALRLDQDFQLDSLDRLQLLAALEERLGLALNQDEYAALESLGQLHAWIEMSSVFAQGLVAASSIPSSLPAAGMERESTPEEPSKLAGSNTESKVQRNKSRPDKVQRHIYPKWPWFWLFRWQRIAFVEAVMRPLVLLLAAPRIRMQAAAILSSESAEPMLIVANHITAFDVPLMLWALPRRIRHHTAVAMSGEMLEDFRHARNMQPRWANPLGPAAWLLLTGMFNVFPLPRQRDFQQSFAHTGQALDSGLNVIIFPEGVRSPEGTLARFRPGIGMLVKQSFALVLPMALLGVGELKAQRKNWFRSGAIEVRVGQPIRFSAEESEATITERLHAAVEALLTGGS